jgi:uncharacterized membrane protein YfcA
MTFALVLFVIAFFAGAISSVAGLGIGSILTPLLALTIGVKLAVAAAAIPHFAGNALRLWTLRKRVDAGVLKTFGVMSAIGALAGALIHARATTTSLKIGLAVVLILAGIAGVFGWMEHLRLGAKGAAAAGGASGFLGALLGFQGGLRAAAMLALNVRKEVFVATAVALAVIVDGARLPVYAWSVGTQLIAIWPLLLAATAGVLLGTMTGKRIFGRIPEELFRRLVSGLLVALGVAILISR